MALQGRASHILQICAFDLQFDRRHANNDGWGKEALWKNHAHFGEVLKEEQCDSLEEKDQTWR